MPDLAALNPPRRPKRPKSRSERVEAVIDRIVQGDEFARMLGNLAPEERDLFWSCIAELRRTGELDMEDLWRIDYARKPPTVQEFIEDDYWVGGVCRKTDESTGLFPGWRDVLTGDFDLDSRIHNVVITGSLGIGKCSPRGTRVIAHDGTLLKVEDIKAGDLLKGDDSGVRTVLKTFQGRGMIYEIYPAKGEPFRATGDHTLCLKTSTSDEVQEMTVKDFMALPMAKRERMRLYRVGVDWEEQPVDIDPYWLGMWLGDGTSCRVELTTADDCNRDYFVEYGLAMGCSLRPLSDADIKSKSRAYCLTTGRARGHKSTNPLRALLNKHNLCFSDPYNPGEKHIPHCYIQNSRAVRLELLAGLMDTDGSVAGSAGVWEITLKVKKLADDVRFLAQSLGYFAQTKIKVVGGRAYYRTVISGAFDVPTHLRKTPAKKPSTRGRYGKTLIEPDGLKSKFAVIPLEEDDYFGFELDGNHRYLLQDFTVTHNSFVSVLLLLYRVAIARCMRNPQSFLGLAKGSAILYVMLSVTKASVKETVWGDAKNFMSNSPFFMEECRFSPGKKYADLHVPLGGNVFLTAGSRGQHILGRNTMGVLLDEGNWRIEANPDMKAYDLYNEVRTRLANRFQKIDGYLPALSILASSARDESSVTESVIHEIQANNKPAAERVYRFAVYRIKRHEIRFGARWFKVEHGLKNTEPRVLSGFYTEEGAPIKVQGLSNEEPGKGAQATLVPEVYLDGFKRNVKTSLQSVCGVSTGGSHRLFSSLELVEKAVQVGKEAGLVNPARMHVIPISDDDKLQVWDYLNHPKFLTRRAGRIIPLRDPEAPRYAHLDLATTSVAGLSICHAIGTTRVDGIYNRETGETFSQYRRVIAYDFILAITAGPTKPISVKKIQDFLFWLRDYCGFRWGKISCDSFGAGIPLQPFDARGIPTEIVSLDKSRIPYYSWRTGFEEGRIMLLDHPILMQEVEYLTDNPATDKIDHPIKTPYGPGTKDIADSSAGCYFTCIGDESKSAGNVSAADVTLHTGQETPDAPPVVTVTPEPPREARRYEV